MPKVVRAFVDLHACGAVDIQGSPNVYVNGSPVHRVSDADSCGGVQVEGSPNVYANNLKIARIGDNNSGCPSPPCVKPPPSPEVTGSPNVYAN